MTTPTDRVYSQTHEWHKLEGPIATIGITRHAVDQLTDITYVEMKKAGTKVAAGDSVGEVESVKTTSDIYAAAAGEIVEVNQAAADNPSLVNEDPYGKGWLVRVRLSDAGALNGLMSAAAYEKANG
jgi:glycine cleavage system H protein